MITPQDATRKLIDSMLGLDLAPSLIEQLKKSTVSSISVTEQGFFADFEAAPSDGAASSDESSIIMTMHCEDEVADVILHLRDGLIRYLEVQFYEELKMVCFEGFTLR